MSYQVNFNPDALDDLRRMPAQLRSRAAKLIDALETDPRPSRSKQLRDPLAHLYRLPLEAWRIIYRIDDAELEVTIVRIKHKTGPETYTDLE